VARYVFTAFWNAQDLDDVIHTVTENKGTGRGAGKGFDIYCTYQPFLRLGEQNVLYKWYSALNLPRTTKSHRKTVSRVAHLWGFCEASVHWIFGDFLGYRCWCSVSLPIPKEGTLVSSNTDSV
jgi:hypothetical protein